MSWDGKTPTNEVNNDITPYVANQCSCGSELIYIDGSEKPPITKAEKALQFHCLYSRAGDLFHCHTHNATWVQLPD